MPTPPPAGSLLGVVVGTKQPKLPLLEMVNEHNSKLCALIQESHAALLHYIEQMSLSDLVLASNPHQDGFNSKSIGSNPSTYRHAPQLPPSPQASDPADVADFPEYSTRTEEVTTKAATCKRARSTDILNQLSRKGHRCCCPKIEQEIEVGEALISRSVQGSGFDTFIGGVIILNSITMFVQYEYVGSKASVSLGLRQDAGSWSRASEWFDALEHAFSMVFLLELVVRLRVIKSRYFSDIANIFDAFLVVSNLIELYILKPLETGFGANLTMLRFIRFCKLVRVLRLIRVMKMFRSLKILIHTIASSVPSLVWSMMLLALIIAISGLFMCQLVSDYITNDANPYDTRKWVFEQYGSSSRATLTMFEATLSGCWPNYSRRLIEEVSVLYVIFFVAYIAGVVFAITRIISAIFLQETLATANHEAEIMVADHRLKRGEFLKKLEEFFAEADQSGDGTLDRAEFEAILNNEDVRAWLAGIELEAHESIALFDLIDDGDGIINFEEWLAGAARLKGQARSVDVISILRQMEKMDCKVDFILEQFDMKATRPIRTSRRLTSSHGSASAAPRRSRFFYAAAG